MVWGTFTVCHIITLIFAIGIGVGLYFLLKNAKQKTQVIVLGILSFSGIAAIVFNLVTWGSPLEYLPLHLCSLNAIALPFAVFTRNKVLGNLLLLWALGALVAIVLNYSMAHCELNSAAFAFYYFPHILEFVIPVLLIKFGLIKLDHRCIVSTIVITMLVYTLIHGINVWVNSYCEANQIVDGGGNLIQVNYMFSIRPENPLLDLFYSIIPGDYWYMYLAVPVVAVYLSVIYSVSYWRAKKRSCVAA